MMNHCSGQIECCFGDYLQALDDLAVSVRGAENTLITGAVCDSRLAFPGCLFVAIPGAKDDGSRYARQAIDAGAVAVVAATALELPEHVLFIQARKLYDTAARIAEVAAGKPAHDMCLHGITGTNGKTTSAFLMRDILKRCGKTTGMIGTVCYEVAGRLIEADRTTPPPFLLQQLFAEMRSAATQDVVLEMSSHALEQHRAGTVFFDSAVFTNLTGDHLDYHGTMENYFQAKKIMFDGYLRDDAPAVINVDDNYGYRLLRELSAAGRRVVSFGRNAEAAYRIDDCRTCVRGSWMRLICGSRPVELSSPLIGLYNIYNIAGTAAAALEVGADLNCLTAAVAEFHGAPGRLQAVKGSSDNGPAVFVDYAHTDDALVNVLSALKQLEHHRLVVVFGCGGDRDRTKRARMAKAAETHADLSIVTSDNPRTEDPEVIIDEICSGFTRRAAAIRVTDRREAIRRALSEATDGDIVLIAGKGHENYQEVNGIKTPFDDVYEVRTVLNGD